MQQPFIRPAFISLRLPFLHTPIVVFLMVHAILGVRSPAGNRGQGSDSQDRMDQVMTMAGYR